MKTAKFFMSRWYAFDNFSAFTVKIRRFKCFDIPVHSMGGVFPTSEHAYQFAKFLIEVDFSGKFRAPARQWSDEERRIMNLYIRRRSTLSRIQSAPSAHLAKAIAKANKNDRRGDWHEVRLDVMEEILRSKLEQHEYVRETLEKSIGMEIIEDSPFDSFWGRGPNHDGKNHLGRLWMKIRDEMYA